MKSGVWDKSTEECFQLLVVVLLLFSTLKIQQNPVPGGTSGRFCQPFMRSDMSTRSLA